MAETIEARRTIPWERVGMWLPVTDEKLVMIKYGTTGIEVDNPKDGLTVLSNSTDGCAGLPLLGNENVRLVFR